MARLAGVDLPRDKRGEVALQYIYGVGRTTALRVLSEARVDANKRVKAWDDAETARVRDMIERELKVDTRLPLTQLVVPNAMKRLFEWQIIMLSL